MTIAHPALLQQVYKQHPIHKHKTSVIAYVGGKHPHVTVTITYGDYGDATSYRLHTPRGWVTVRWRQDDGTEDGGPVPVGPEPDISHPDTIKNIVIISPPAFPVYFQGADDAKWVHVNGYRLPSVETRTVSRNGLYHYTYTHLADPVLMDGGLNIVAVGYPDAE